jgi:hypothetical protein
VVASAVVLRKSRRVNGLFMASLPVRYRLDVI